MKKLPWATYINWRRNQIAKTGTKTNFDSEKLNVERRGKRLFVVEYQSDIELCLTFELVEIGFDIAN